MAGLGPQGEAIRRAVQWLSDARKENPDATLTQLLDQAAQRFDLTPLDAEFLLREYKRATSTDPAR